MKGTISYEQGQLEKDSLFPKNNCKKPIERKSARVIFQGWKRYEEAEEEE